MASASTAATTTTLPGSPIGQPRTPSYSKLRRVSSKRSCCCSSSPASSTDPSSSTISAASTAKSTTSSKHTAPESDLTSTSPSSFYVVKKLAVITFSLILAKAILNVIHYLINAALTLGMLSTIASIFVWWHDGRSPSVADGQKTWLVDNCKTSMEYILWVVDKVPVGPLERILHRI